MLRWHIIPTKAHINIPLCDFQFYTLIYDLVLVESPSSLCPPLTVKLTFPRGLLPTDSVVRNRTQPIVSDSLFLQMSCSVLFSFHISKPHRDKTGDYVSLWSTRLLLQLFSSWWYQNVVKPHSVSVGRVVGVVGGLAIAGALNTKSTECRLHLVGEN